MKEIQEDSNQSSKREGEDMAARNRKGLSENTRARIQTTMIVKRLEDHILGKVEMKPSQVQAASVLIKKTLPDLQAIRVQNDALNNPLGSMTYDEIQAELEEIRRLAEILESNSDNYGRQGSRK